MLFRDITVLASELFASQILDVCLRCGSKGLLVNNEYVARVLVPNILMNSQRMYSSTSMMPASRLVLLTRSRQGNDMVTVNFYPNSDSPVANVVAAS